MKATLIKNSLGHVSVWFERKTNREADLYLQAQTDTEGITEFVPLKKRDDFDNGYNVRADIPDEYDPYNDTRIKQFKGILY